MKNLAFFYLILAAVLDIIANILLQKSKGFSKPRYGIPALIMVCLAFTLLAWATEHMELTMAYVTWGALAILGTAISARIFLQEKLNRLGWLGIFLILISIVLLRTA